MPHDIEEPGSWIARFDGSCKAPRSTNPKAGAGVAIFKADEMGRAQEISRYTWPLPFACNAQMAEAYASRLAIELVVRAAGGRPTRDRIIVQGDNINVIGYWQ